MAAGLLNHDADQKVVKSKGVVLRQAMETMTTIGDENEMKNKEREEKEEVEEVGQPYGRNWSFWSLHFKCLFLQ